MDRYEQLRLLDRDDAIRPASNDLSPPPFRAVARRLSFGQGMRSQGPLSQLVSTDSNALFARTPLSLRGRLLDSAFDDAPRGAARGVLAGDLIAQPWGAYLIDGETEMRFQALPAELRQFITHTEQYRNYEIPEGLEVASLAEILTVMQMIYLGGAQNVEPHWHPNSWALLPAEHAQTITNFLGKLCGTADFLHSPEMRRNLLTRVDHLLKAIHTDSVIFDSIVVLMEEANTSCVDRTTLLMSEADLTVRLLNIERRFDDLQAAETELAALGIGLIRLNAVRDFARRYCQVNGVEDEEIQYQLIFEITLKEALGLPILANLSAFERWFQVDENNLDAAYYLAMDKSEDHGSRLDFFANWEPWQMMLRQKSVLLLPYADIPVAKFPVSPTVLRELRCSITQEDFINVDQPVFVGQGERIRLYDFDSLMIWWRKNGTDPTTRQRFELSELYRTP